MIGAAVGVAPGLPDRLPAGEALLWQGRPDRAALARSAFHVRGVAIYFALLTAVGVGLSLDEGFSAMGGAAATAGCGVAAIAILNLLAWATARSSHYSLTDRRLVLRIGVAIPKYINLPLSAVAGAGLRLNANGSGDLPLTLAGSPPLGWVALWPHARPWRLARPEPMLRAVPGAANVATLLASALVERQGAGRVVEAAPVERPMPAGALAA